MQVELGSKVTDATTGFTGIATARCVYLGGGPARIRVEAHITDPSKSPEAEWFDEHRVAPADAADGPAGS